MGKPTIGIAVFACNRPHHLNRLLSSVAEANRESQLPVFAYVDRHKGDLDGLEQAACIEVLQQYAPRLQISTIKRTRNLGVAQNISTGISHLLERFDAAIVLEDDLVIAPTAIAFFQEALAKYYGNPTVMSINGHFPKKSTPHTAPGLVRHACAWGWATWRDSWSHYEGDASILKNKLSNAKAWRDFEAGQWFHHRKMLGDQRRGLIDTWDICWRASIVIAGGWVVQSPRNLISNRGFDGTGTHTMGPDRTNTTLEEFIRDTLPDNVEYSPTLESAWHESIREDDPLWRQTLLLLLPSPIRARLRLLRARREGRPALQARDALLEKT